jgi:magnesium transporter
MREVHRKKRDLGLLKICVWPIRDVLSKMRGGVDHISDETQLYLRDCHDHVIQVLDIIESYRERLSSLNDLYLSSVSARLNEVMKVLTIISTIFIPLSFVAGIYGMNFDTSHPWNMPELLQPYGYIMVLGFMASMGCIMMWGFYRAGWIGRGTRDLK